MTDYRKKLKNRLYLAISYLIIGALMLAAAFITKAENSFISSFGIALLVCGIVRIKNYFSITKNEQSIRQQEIKETDERNLEMISRARSMTFSLYLLIAGTAVIVLQFINMQIQSQIVAYNICFFVFLYWICYSFVKRKC